MLNNLNSPDISRWLGEYCARVDANGLRVTDEEDAIDEALRSVRPGYREVRA